jgi:SMC interacting uncharacterized protein involved in chromosome segregation
MWDNIQSADPFENPDEEESDDSIFFNFAISTYNAFLQGSDDFSHMEDELIAIFGMLQNRICRTPALSGILNSSVADDKNKRNLDVISDLTEQNARIEQEYDVLRQRPVCIVYFV